MLAGEELHLNSRGTDHTPKGLLVADSFQLQDAF